MQPAAHLDPRRLRSALGRPHPNPLLLLCRLMIERGFRCACQTHDGTPTEDARDAVLWLTSHLDWTHDHGPIPPEDLRTEFILSFEFCCAYLNLDPDEVRRQGLPRDVATLDPSKRRMHIRPRIDRGHNSRVHIYGLPDVYQRWKAAAARHAAEIDEHECVDTAPLSEAFEDNLVRI